MCNENARLSGLTLNAIGSVGGGVETKGQQYSEWRNVMLVCPNCGAEINISEVGEVCTNCGIQVPLDMEMEDEDDSKVDDDTI